MCGIFGYIGLKNAVKTAINGLKKLEYRGYDSAGVYIAEQGTFKAVGPVNNLAKKVRTVEING